MKHSIFKRMLALVLTFIMALTVFPMMNVSALDASDAGASLTIGSTTTYHESLSAAIAAASKKTSSSNPGTITLLKDETVSSGIYISGPATGNALTLIIDFNDHKLTYTGAYAENDDINNPTKAALSISGKAYITLKNSGKNCTGGVVATNGTAIVLSGIGGRLTIESGHYTAARAALRFVSGGMSKNFNINFNIKGGSFVGAPALDIISYSQEFDYNGHPYIDISGGSFAGKDANSASVKIRRSSPYENTTSDEKCINLLDEDNRGLKWLDKDGNNLGNSSGNNKGPAQTNTINVPVFVGTNKNKDGGCGCPCGCTGVCECDHATVKYTVTWLDDDGTELESVEVASGSDVPEYPGEEPTKAPTAEKSFKFSEWVITEGELKDGKVVCDITYTATYDESTNSYTVTWLDDDGTELLVQEGVPYGSEPSYPYDNPTKESDPDDDFIYKFKEWVDKQGALDDGKVVCDVALTASYEELPKEFVLTLTGADELIEEVPEYVITVTDEDHSVYEFTAEDKLAAPFNSTKDIEHIPYGTTVKFTVNVTEGFTASTMKVRAINSDDPSDVTELTPDEVSADKRSYVYYVTMDKNITITVNDGEGEEDFIKDTEAPVISAIVSFDEKTTAGDTPCRTEDQPISSGDVVNYAVTLSANDLYLQSLALYKDGEKLAADEFSPYTDETVTVKVGETIEFNGSVLVNNEDVEDVVGEYKLVAIDLEGNETVFEFTYEETWTDITYLAAVNKFGKEIKKIDYIETSFKVVALGYDLHDLMIKVIDDNGKELVAPFTIDNKVDDRNADFYPFGERDVNLTIPMNYLHRTRELTIVVFDADSGKTLKEYTLKQRPYPDELRIVPETLYFEYEGGTMNKQDAGIVANYAWTADCDAEWVHFDRQGLGSSAEPIWCDPNYTGQTRVATITYKTNGEDFVIKTLTIVQYPEKKEQKPTVEIDRIAGTDRLETAIEISKKGWNKADAVVLARYDVFADALAGAPLAYALDAPILLTESDEIAKIVLDEIARLGTKTVYILGGDSAIYEDVEKTLIDLGYTVLRLEGATRTETAIEVAKKLDELVDGEFENVFFVSGDTFADALSISPVAGLKGQPILYIRANSTIDASTSAYVKALGIKTSTIVGGPVAVTDNAKASVVALGVEAHRVYGADRFMTSLEVAKKYDAIFSGKGVAIATGKNFPDALAGSVFAAKNKMPVILVGDSVNAATSEYFTAKAFSHVVIFGGEDAVTTKVVNDLID